MTQAFEQSYLFTHKQENGAADKFILSTLQGEHSETFSGIFRGAQPQWPGWKLIDAGDRDSQELKSLEKGFFFEEFWLRMKCEQLPFPLSALVYDFGVNSGRTTAVKALQRLLALSPSEIDGIIDANTIAKVRGLHPEKLNMRYLAARLDFLNDLSGWKINSGGWSQRIVELLRLAAQ